MKKYFELEKQNNEYFIKFVELGGDQNTLLNNSEMLRTIPVRERYLIILLYSKSMIFLSTLKRILDFMREIKNHKGNANIENALLNRCNNLFYLCTNDPMTAEN
jgi:hypothetical protein